MEHVLVIFSVTFEYNFFSKIYFYLTCHFYLSIKGNYLFFIVLLSVLFFNT